MISSTYITQRIVQSNSMLRPINDFGIVRKMLLYKNEWTNQFIYSLFSIKKAKKKKEKRKKMLHFIEPLCLTIDWIECCTLRGRSTINLFRWKLSLGEGSYVRCSWKDVPKGAFRISLSHMLEINHVPLICNAIKICHVNEFDTRGIWRI